MQHSTRQFAIIAGSGFRSLVTPGAAELTKTRFGLPSSVLRDLTIAGKTVRLLLRHGDNFSIPPHAINYRANMQLLQQVGVTDVVGINTVGIINSTMKPGQLVVPDQIIDYTYGRDHSIYDASSATLDHMDFTRPFHQGLRRELLAAASGVAMNCYDGAVYAVTQGPRLETAAEIDRLERDGADIVGMTAMPEAGLARELGMNYACLSLLVNPAAGRGEQELHDDIEAFTHIARTNCMTVLGAFF